RTAEEAIDGVWRRHVHPVRDRVARKPPRERDRYEEDEIQQRERRRARDRPVASARPDATPDARDRRGQQIRKEDGEQQQNADALERAKHPERKYYGRIRSRRRIVEGA